MPGSAAHRTIDCRGLLCPLPVRKAERALRDMETGQVLEVLADDPMAAVDIPAFGARCGHSVRTRREAEGMLIFLVVKGT